MNPDKRDQLSKNFFSFLKKTDDRYFNIPFVRGIIEEGMYVTHEYEPTLFSPSPRGLNASWLSWLQHFLVFGEKGIHEFSNNRSATFPIELQRVASAVFVIITAELNDPSIKLPEKPPKILTRSGEYISQRWVLDVCRRDNISPHEAYTLGIALTR